MTHHTDVRTPTRTASARRIGDAPTADSGLLRARPVTVARELARFVRERRREVLETWEREALGRAETRGLPRPALLDHVDEVLDAIAALLETPRNDEVALAATPHGVEVHVLTRLEVGASLTLVLGELALLRQVIERLWLDRPSDAAPPGLEALRDLAWAVEVVMIQSTRRFGEVRLRLFETLERLAVAAGRRPLPEFLTDLLRIALDGVPGVDTATILLREGDLLHVRAAVGVEGPTAATAPLHMGEGFAGLVAAERRPILLRDASSDALIKRPALRRAGIRGLYGVPLLAASADGEVVLGVAHMGSRRSNDFTDEAKTLFRIVVSRAAVLVHEALLREKVEEQQARFRAIADMSPAIVFLKGLDGRYQFMSRRAIELVGYSPDTFLGRTDREVWPPAVAEGIEATDRRVLASRDSVTTEETIPTRDGKRRIYVTSKFPVLDRAGRIAAIGGVATDITERKRREEAQALLARAGALLAESLDVEGALTTLADLVVPALADWGIVDLVEEDGAIRRLRVVHADPSQAALAATFHALPVDPSRPHLGQAALEARRPILVREVLPGYLDSVAQSPEHRRALGELAPRSMLQVPFMARGRLLGALVLVSTAPEDERYGRDDLALAEDLARLASLTIDNTRLYASAQRAVRARDEVLAIVAHDLRNPLNVVVTAISGVLAAPESADPGSRRHRLEVALDAARRAGRLTNDLLDVSRVEAGRFTVRVAPRAPGDLLRDAGEAQRAIAVQGGLELIVEASDALPPVMADNDRILQVLDNLLTNALRYTPREGRVALRADRVGAEVRFVVEDTGPGIPSEEQARVFERFWQGRRANRRGAGLGLPIARAIVEAHGGRMWLESPPGGGARVCFTLPVADR